VASVGLGFVLACAAIGTASAWCEHVTTLLETSAHYAAAALVQMVRPAAYVAGLGGLLAVREGTTDLGHVVVALAVSWAATCLLTAGMALRTVPMRPVRTTRADLRRLWRAAWPLTLFSVSQLVFGTVDLYFVRIFAAPEDVGHYGLAYQAFGMGAVLASAVPALIAPRLIRARAEGRDAITPYLRAVGRTVLPVVAAALAIGVPLVPLLVRTFFGDRYEESSEPLVVLALALLLLVGSSLLGPVLLVAEATSVIGRTAVVAVGVNILLDLVLLGWWGTGIVGPAAATAIACGVTFLAYCREVTRRADVAVFNSAIAVALVAVAVVATLLLPVQIALPLAAATAGLFLGVLRLTGRLDLPLRVAGA
jgi:O-antigen/teichoic acid export membrane protein